MLNNSINSTAYRLVNPGIFKKMEINHTLQENDVEVVPYLTSVCHADLRYFTGSRKKEALEAKLPMALFHEGLGVVKQSLHSSFKKGDRVAIVPSIPGYVLNHTTPEECCQNCASNGDPNYCEKGEFLGSGYDGIGQSNLVIGGENLVKVPEELDDQIAILSELCSVSLYAINLVDYGHLSNSKVAVFGDGPVGYLTASALHYIYNIPKERLLVFGAVEEKLSQFEKFATIALVHDFDFKHEADINTVFECTGGKFSYSAINQAIDLIERKGTLILMGVTEELVPINTRDILEKGINVIGSSRSTTKEFLQLMEAFKDKEYERVLKKLIPEKTHTVKTTEDLKNAMNVAVNNKGGKKVYISFDWMSNKI